MTPARTGKAKACQRYLNRRTIVLAVAGALAIALHLGLGGAVLANSRWTGWAAGIILVIVLLKIARIVLGGFGILHRRAANVRREHVSDEGAKVER